MILIFVDELAGPTGYHKSVVETANALTGRGYPVAVLSLLGQGDGSALAMPRWPLDPEVPVLPLQSLPADGGRLLASNVHPVLEGRVYSTRYAITENQLAAIRQLSDGLDASDTIIFTTALQALIFHRALAGRPRTVRTVLQAHGDYRHHDQLVALVAEARASIDIVQTVAEGLREQFIPQFAPEHVVCVPNIHRAVDVPRTPHDGVRIVLPASFQHRKNQLDAVRALARIEDPSVHLMLWGNISPLNPYFIALQEEIEHLGLEDRVQIPGFGTEQDVYGTADIVLMTSLSEGFGYPLLEAAHHRLPTVAYDFDFGPRDVIEDGESGYIVPLGDVDQLARRLAALVGDDELRRRLGERARAIFDERFSADAVVDRYAAVLGPADAREVDLAELFATDGHEAVEAGAVSHRTRGWGPRKVHQLLVRSDAPLHDIRIDDGTRRAEPAVERSPGRTMIEFPATGSDVVSYASEPGSADRHYLVGPVTGDRAPLLPRLRRDATYGDGAPPVEDDAIFAARGGAGHVSWRTTPRALMSFGAQATEAVIWKSGQVTTMLAARRAAASTAPTAPAEASAPTEAPAQADAHVQTTTPGQEAAPAPTDAPAQTDATSPAPAPTAGGSEAQGLQRRLRLPLDASRVAMRVGRTYARTAATMAMNAVAVKESMPTRREIPRHPWYPVSSGVDSFGAPINTTGGVRVANSGTQERPTVTIQGEYDWLLLRDGASQRRVEPPWSYGELFEAFCAAERDYGLFDITTDDGVHVWELGRSALVIQLAEAAGLWGPSVNAGGTVADISPVRKRIVDAPRARTVVFDYVRRGQTGYRTAPFVRDDSLFVVQPSADGYPDVTESNMVYPFGEFTAWRNGWHRRWDHLRVPEVDARPFEEALSRTLGIHVDLGDHLRNRLAKFLAEREFFTPVFERVRPEEVLIASSHWWAGIGAAAARSGARVSDIQYALTSRYAPSFWFGGRPHYGASRFYAWSDFWAERTNAYAEHVVVPREQPELRALMEAPADRERSWDVCVISQPRVLRRILAFVKDLVRERPELRVVIAPHPAQREIIGQELAAAGLADAVAVAEQDTLTTVASSVLAVGTFSTSMWEAAALGVPSYVIEVPGHEETLQDVASGLFRIARSPHDLVPFDVPESRRDIFG